MELSNEQIKTISSSIILEDIKDYIENHKMEYEEFLKKKKVI